MITRIAKEVLAYCIVILGACAFISFVGLMVAVDVKIVSWLFGL